MSQKVTRPVTSGAGKVQVGETSTLMVTDSPRRPCRLCADGDRPLVTVGSSRWWDQCANCRGVPGEPPYDSTDLARSYALGALHERARVERAAAADHEHRQTWARLGQRASADRRQELLRLFEHCAEEFHQREFGRAYVPFTGVAE